MRVRILGCGSSAGTPTVDHGWGRCDPTNPKNRRTRPSILVEDGDTRLLVDTSPDLRQQMLDAGIAKLTAILYTHAHADHLHGIDDLRAVNRAIKAPLPVYADQATLDVITQRFEYVVEPLTGDGTHFYKPMLLPERIGPGDRRQIGGINVDVFDQDHGFSRTLGFRFGPVAYSTDVTELPDASFAAVEGVRLWIIGTMMARPHPTHCDVDKALRWVERIRPARAILTHLGSDLDYAELSARLPAGVEPAYDGMVVDVAEAATAVDSEGDSRVVAAGE